MVVCAVREGLPDFITVSIEGLRRCLHALYAGCQYGGLKSLQKTCESYQNI